MVARMASNDVVRRHERPTMRASFSCTASTNLAGVTSTPRSTTRKPLAPSTPATMSLPMSWMSPCTEPRITVALASASAADWSTPRTSRARLKISADMMSSDR